ncbi:hypothetical protein K474DRAFT_1667677 [Panus rudis PR-1116 ss-1]|nr:hypothetical protein K474DRAFT_1667677 [Panus rudis PR-1116 ss-1]
MAYESLSNLAALVPFLHSRSRSESLYITRPLPLSGKPLAVHSHSPCQSSMAYPTFLGHLFAICVGLARHQWSLQVFLLNPRLCHSSLYDPQYPCYRLDYRSRSHTIPTLFSPPFLQVTRERQYQNAIQIYLVHVDVAYRMSPSGAWAC